MPVAIVLIIGVVIIAIVLIGIIWSFLLLVPFYPFVGIAGFLIWRSRRKEAEIAAEVEREASSPVACCRSCARGQRTVKRREEGLPVSAYYIVVPSSLRTAHWCLPSYPSLKLGTSPG